MIFDSLIGQFVSDIAISEVKGVIGWWSRYSDVVLEVVSASDLLLKSSYLDLMDNLLKTAAIVEQDHSQEEETKAIDAADDPIEGGNPAVVDLLICVSFAREAESEHSDQVCTIRKDIEDEEERLE